MIYELKTIGKFNLLVIRFWKVLAGEADLTIGGYLSSEIRALAFSLGTPYMQASTGFCFRESNAFSPLTRLTAPFKGHLWTLNAVILFISIVIILSTKRLTRKWRHFYIGGRLNRTPILNMLAVVLGNPISNRQIANAQHLGTFARTLTILWIIQWLVIRNSYQGALYNYLQSHRLTSSCDTIQKIRTADCKIVVPATLYFTLKDTFDNDR